MDVNARYLRFAPEVRDALACGTPVVALESTVISHGLPFPDNLETASGMEAEIRFAGAVPATIGLLDGAVVVGLNHAEIERLAVSPSVTKVSRRDFAPVLAQRLEGATTVAGSMMVSAAAGIRFFATGGIGGAHRGATQSFDISADLLELGSSPVGVLCAGPKAILDIGLTLEILETQGVPVVGFRTAHLPLFYSSGRDHPLEYSYPLAEQVARMAWTQWDLGLRSGILITTPPPPEHALDPSEVESLIAEALRAAAIQSVQGKAITPFLLSYLVTASSGRTLAVNKALLLNNARVAAEIALEYSKIDAKEHATPNARTSQHLLR